MDRPESPPLTETDLSHYFFQQQYPTHLSRSKSPHSFVSAFASHATGDSSVQAGTQPLHLPSFLPHDTTLNTVVDQGPMPSFFEPISDAFTGGPETEAFAPAYYRPSTVISSDLYEGLEVSQSEGMVPAAVPRVLPSNDLHHVYGPNVQLGGLHSGQPPIMLDPFHGIEHGIETGPMFDNLSVMRNQESAVQFCPPGPTFDPHSSAGLPYWDDITHPAPMLLDAQQEWPSRMLETHPAMSQQNSFASIPQESNVPSAFLTSLSDPWWALSAADLIGKGDLQVILEDANPENRPYYPYKRWIRITSRTRQQTVEVTFDKFRQHMHVINLAKLKDSLQKIAPYLPRMAQILPRDNELPKQIKKFDDQLSSAEFSNFLSAAYLRDLRKCFDAMHQSFRDHEEEKDRPDTLHKGWTIIRDHKDTMLRLGQYLLVIDMAFELQAKWNVHEMILRPEVRD